MTRTFTTFVAPAVFASALFAGTAAEALTSPKPNASSTSLLRPARPSLTRPAQVKTLATLASKRSTSTTAKSPRTN